MKTNHFFSVFCLSVLLCTGTSCGTGLLKAGFLSGYDRLGLNTIDVSGLNAQELLERIETLTARINSTDPKTGSAAFDEIAGEIHSVTELYNSFLAMEKVADYENCLYIIPAKTRVICKVDTYCLDSGKSSPEQNEPYILCKSDPGIPFFREIMKYSNTKERVNKSLKQKLFWNLQNKVKFEDLSDQERDLLTRIDKLAYLKIDSHLKAAAGSLLNQYLPFAKEAGNISGLIRGMAHDYSEYADAISRLSSKFPLPQVSGPIKSEGYDIYTETRHSGYGSCIISFINNTPDRQEINCYLKPLRTDVQPLAFDLPASIDNTLNTRIKLAFGKLVASSLDAFFKAYTEINVHSSVKSIKGGDRLTIEENPYRLIDIWKAFRDMNKAFLLTERACSENPGMCSADRHNCKGDAFRHAVWNALMQRDVGDFSADIADNHELNDNNKEENAMDKHNNSAGRNMGRRLKDSGVFDDESYYQEVLKYMNDLISIK